MDKITENPAFLIIDMVKDYFDDQNPLYPLLRIATASDLMTELK